MAHRISVKEAAEQIGIRMQAGQFKEIGFALPGINGKKRYEYFIYQEKLDRYLGKKLEGESFNNT